MIKLKKMTVLLFTISFLLIWACSCSTRVEARTSSAEPTIQNKSTESITETSVNSSGEVDEEQSQSLDKAVQYLIGRMDETVGDLYIYKDFGVNQNHFAAKGKISSSGHESLVYNMDENYQKDTASGSSCIKCRIGTSAGSWGGWLFINGTLPKGKTEPVPVWGDVAGCAMDLSGAVKLTFMARGETGGERVEFFTGGLGRSGETGRATSSYPDSAAKISTGVIKLSNTWKEYTINLEGKDLSSVGCGFGFVVAGSSKGDVVFYLDDICFRGNVVSIDTPRFIASYETSVEERADSKYIANAAFSYDNALCAMAFTSVGEQERARLILDAFVYAIENDRYPGSKVRNAYAYGNPHSFPGWGGYARLPGFYEDGKYCEDAYQVGTNIGNTSYVVLALLKYYNKYGGEKYLDTAGAIMDSTLQYCADDSGCGYFAGYDGWPESGDVKRFTYKSTEHNIDVYAACSALYEITHDKKYSDAASSALRFIDTMYDKTMGIFWSGTTEDGVTANKSNIVLDVQIWSVLALKDSAGPYMDCVQYAIDNLKTRSGGYAFSQSDVSDGYWLEGTAFCALLFKQLEMNTQAEDAFYAIEAAELVSGGLPAVSDSKSLDTGFYLSTGEKWQYYDEPHIAPVAWYILALENDNPYNLH